MGGGMTDTADTLISELQELGKLWRCPGLIVAFPTKTLLIRANEPAAREKIASALSSGGHPVAVFGITPEDAMRLHLRASYQTPEWLMFLSETAQLLTRAAQKTLNQFSAGE
jgi:hypothetical protein